MIKNVYNVGRFEFTYEDPNSHIHSFNGIMKDKKEKERNSC